MQLTIIVIALWAFQTTFEVFAEPYIAGHYEDILLVSKTGTSQGCIERKGASYLVPHFDHLSLASSCALVVRSGEHSPFVYDASTAQSRKNSTFWGFPVHGDTLCYEYTCSDAKDYEFSSFIMDQIGVGNSSVHPGIRSLRHSSQEQNRDLIVCGQADFVSIDTLANSSDLYEQAMYQASQGVVYLSINGIGICTGFLVGRNSIITARHCFENARGVFQESALTQGTTVSFGYEVGREPVVFAARSRIADGSEYATDDDWVLFDMHPLTNHAGSTTVVASDLFPPIILRESSISMEVSGQPMFIPQHAGPNPKSVVFENDFEGNGTCSIRSISTKSVRYTCDTQGGSSGAPLLVWDPQGDIHLVGIHRAFSGCSSILGNTGLRASRFVSLVLPLVDQATSSPTAMSRLPSISPSALPTPIVSLDSSIAPSTYPSDEPSVVEFRPTAGPSSSVQSASPSYRDDFPSESPQSSPPTISNMPIDDGGITQNATTTITTASTVASTTTTSQALQTTTSSTTSLLSRTPTMEPSDYPSQSPSITITPSLNPSSSAFPSKSGSPSLAPSLSMVPSLLRNNLSSYPTRLESTIEEQPKAPSASFEPMPSSSSSGGWQERLSWYGSHLLMHLGWMVWFVH